MWPVAAVAAAVLLTQPVPAAAVSPTSKTFVISAAAPIEAITVDVLAPTNARAKRFTGSAVLQLSGSGPLAMTARLAHKRKKDTGHYAFASTARGFPRFKGTIVTHGEPETVRKVRIVLQRGRRDRVTVTAVGSVTMTPGASVPSPTTTTTTTAVSTTTTSTLAPITSGCFEDHHDGTIRDTCTGLQWSKKESGADAANLHAVSNRYTWARYCSSAPCQATAAAAAACVTHSGVGAYGCSECPNECVDPNDADAVTTIWDWLTQVNAAAYAGHTDWRIPHAEVLETILAPEGCSAPCIDPLFGPTIGGYWSATTSSEGPADALIVFFRSDRDVNDFSKTLVSHVRAVRSMP